MKYKHKMKMLNSKEFKFKIQNNKLNRWMVNL